PGTALTGRPDSRTGPSWRKSRPLSPGGWMSRMIASGRSCSRLARAASALRTRTDSCPSSIRKSRKTALTSGSSSTTRTRMREVSLARRPAGGLCARRRLRGRRDGRGACGLRAVEERGPEARRGAQIGPAQQRERFGPVRRSIREAVEGGDAPRSQLGVEYRSEEHTSELQSRFDLVCRLLLEKKNKNYIDNL